MGPSARIHDGHAHQHFVEPKGTTILIDLAIAIVEQVERPVDWIHLPVPKGRRDAAYFASLSNLTNLGRAEL
jgi:hypothetical protein